MTIAAEIDDDVTPACSTAVHFAGYVEIVTKGASWEHPVSNRHQMKIDMIVEYCLAHGLPCRILALKPRQKGSSTKSTHTVYHQMRARRCEALIMGDTDDTTDKMVAMIRRHQERDSYSWPNSIIINAEKVTCSNGSVCRMATASGKNPGIGGTVQIALFTEVAKYAKEGKLNADDIMLSVLPSIPDEPDTIIIAETTANGIGGWFHDHYAGHEEKGNLGAVSFADFVTGKRGNGWIKIFTAWFEFPDSILRRGDHNDAWFIGPARDSREFNREQHLRKAYGCTDEHLAWRRKTIQQQCGGDPRKFDQEYPEDDVLAFLVSGRPAFDFDGLARLHAQASGRLPEYYVLGDMPTSRPGEVPTLSLQRVEKEQAWLWMWEPPIPGCRYIAGGDVASGADITRGGNPDCHAIGVMREYYMDVNHTWHADALVARIEPECRYTIDRMVECTDLMSRHYGGASRCLVVFERNAPGLAAIKVAQGRGMPLWMEQTLDKITQEQTKRPGWYTTEQSRAIGMRGLGSAILGLSKASGEMEEDGVTERMVKECTVDIWCPHLVKELRTAITDATGKIVGGPGSHDDDVMMLMILLACVKDGTICTVRKVRKPGPDDNYREVRDPRRGYRR